MMSGVARRRRSAVSALPVATVHPAAEPRARAAVFARVVATADPVRRTTAGLVGLLGAGFVAIFLAWRGVAATLDVWVQLPFLVSGAFCGVALVGAAAGLLSTHLDRQHAAEEREALERLIDIAEQMLR
jgi:hypothetical protein